MFGASENCRMALSRFWTIIVITSIAWAFILLFAGRFYSLSGIVNGKQGDALIIAEKDSQEIKSTDSTFFRNIKANGAEGFQRTDSLFTLSKSGVIEISR